MEQFCTYISPVCSSCHVLTNVDSGSGDPAKLLSAALVMVFNHSDRKQTKTQMKLVLTGVLESDMMTHACSPSIWEAETGGWPAQS